MTETTTFCAAPQCTKPSPAGVLCSECYEELQQHVANLPWALEQLQASATNQVRFTTGAGAKSSETPLLFNPHASTALASLVATVHIWQSRVADHAGVPVRFTGAIQAARWIGDHLATIRTFIDAGRMLDALVHALDHVERTINRPPPSQFLGDCANTVEGKTCPGRMFAHPAEHVAHCDTCHRPIDADTRRLELLRQLDDKHLSAAEIARMATYLNLTINREQVRKRINQWHTRGRITAADEVGGVPRFRFLEVRLLLDQDEETRHSA